jgi:hypothetical protein
MTKMGWFLAAISVGCACAAVLAFALLSARQGVTGIDFDRVENGMTMTTVESILGGRSEGNSPPTHYWTGDEGEEFLLVEIDFDAEDRVVAKKLHRVRLDFSGKLMRFLGLSIL